MLPFFPERADVEPISTSAILRPGGSETDQALDNLLICQVSENVQRRLTTVTNLSQLAQIVVNVLFFKTACQDLETLLVTLR